MHRSRRSAFLIIPPLPCGGPVMSTVRGQEFAPRCTDSERERMKHFLIGLLILSFSYRTLGQTSNVIVKTPSMEPNIHVDDLLIVDESYYSTNPVQRFDIVSLKHPSQGFKTVARIIALGGETISIKDNKVFINKKELKEPFKTRPCAEEKEESTFPCATFGPFKVPDGEFFFLADDRGGSLDSRLLTPHTVSQSYILGKVVKIVSKPKPPNSGVQRRARSGFRMVHRSARLAPAGARRWSATVLQ
jgi:signal peptidase I